MKSKTKRFARKRRQKSKKKSLTLKKIFFFSFFLALLIAIPIFIINFFKTKFLNIEEINCSIENKKICPSQLTNELNALKTKMLLTLNTEEEIKKIAKPVFNFSQFSYRKKWPKTLIIDFKLKNNLYMAVDENKQKIAFDNEGRILNFYHHNNNSFLIKINNNQIQNNQLDSRIHPIIVDFLNLKNQENWPIQQLNFRKTDEFLFTATSDNFCAIFDLNHYLNKFNQFDELIKNYGQVDINNKEVDLRFNLTVLREKTEICQD